jgi:predicted NACHT family NTPase
MMMGRSLSSSPEGIQKAEKALIRFSLTQKALAKELNVTRQPISKFLTGKPVDRNLFVRICEFLELDWEEVITQVNEPETEANPDTSIEIDTLVQEIREKIKPLIQERCGTMRVLDMTQPIGLNDIYTSVNILETITGRQRRGIEELLQQCNQEDFYRFALGKIKQKRVPGLDAVQKYPKLMILGKPGAGKTTFLKYLAIQCIEGVFHSHVVPIFVTLKNFAEADNKPSLLKFIIAESSSINFSFQDVENLLTQGRMLILLDGLDEVREEDSNRILKEITNFSRNFQQNQFVITCRIAAKEYTFEKFTEVEVADFDQEQIATFATSWFKNKPIKPENFIKHIEYNEPIQELATNPLLLTLLCLAFEESGDFPANRSELYKEGLDALLKKWDAKRGIQRDQIYGRLSPQRKEDLLSKIAFTTFEQSDYFFKQKVAEQYIIEYIINLPDANNDPEALQLDSEKILKSIEAQHGLLVERAKGIYSFSHLTFHEYFTAREFVLVQQSSDDALQSLVSHFTEKRWREVCLLAVEMSPHAERLLLFIKKNIDMLVNKYEKFQQFLIWVKNKSLSVQGSYKPAAVRALYFVLYLDPHLDNDSLDLYLHLDLDITIDPFFDFDFDIALYQSLDFHLYLKQNNSFDHDHSFSRTLDLCLDYDLSRTLDPKLNHSLQQLQEKIPDRDEDIKGYMNWWKTNSQA